MNYCFGVHYLSPVHFTISDGEAIEVAWLPSTSLHFDCSFHTISEEVTSPTSPISFILVESYFSIFIAEVGGSG